MIIVRPEGEIFKVEVTEVMAGGPPAANSGFSRVKYGGDLDEEEAIVSIHAQYGPLAQTYRAVQYLVESGIRYISGAMLTPENAPLSDDPEVEELSRMEFEELFEELGFSAGTPPIFSLPESALRNAKGLIAALQFSGFAERNPASLNPRYINIELASVPLERILADESLDLIRAAPGRRVKGPHEAIAAEVEDDLWWAPEFQYRKGTRNVDRTVAEIWVLLCGSEDPAGALSWWLYPNSWLGNIPPADLVGRERDSQLMFAVNQAIGGDW